MFRLACGVPTLFTEHRHSTSPDLCTLINPYRYQQQSKFVSGLPGSLRDWKLGWTLTQVGLTSYMSVVVPLSCSLMLLLALPLIEETLHQKIYRLLLVKESFSLRAEMVVRSTTKVMTISGF